MLDKLSKRSSLSGWALSITKTMSICIKRTLEIDVDEILIRRIFVYFGGEDISERLEIFCSAFIVDRANGSSRLAATFRFQWRICQQKSWKRATEKDKKAEKTAAFGHRNLKQFQSLHKCTYVLADHRTPKLSSR